MEIGTESTGAVMDIRLSGKPNQTKSYRVTHKGWDCKDDLKLYFDWAKKKVYSSWET